jgi:CRISPR-associated protein Csx14
LELTFHFTNDPDNAVFFSIAGGRKTMSACLIAAAQLYGRPQDRIYHVLIAPEYESSRDFFYPPRQSVAIELRGQDGQPYFKETRYALVNLVPLPFVSVREQISNDLLSKPQDPATLMLSLIKEESYTLTVDLSAKKIIYKNMELDMMPTHLSLYAFFVMQKKNCNFEINSCRACHKCFLDFQGIAGKQEQITALYIKAKDGADIEEMSNTGITRLTAENFNSYKTKIKTELTRGFGLRALAELAIESVGSKPDTGYGIALDREKIRVVF